MVVETRVRETDIHKVERNQNVAVRVEAYPDLRLTGKVTLVGTLAQEERERRGSKFFSVTVQVDQSEPRLRPGMTARVQIEVEERAKALFVPLEAVFERDGRSLVYLAGRRPLAARGGARPVERRLRGDREGPRARPARPAARPRGRAPGAQRWQRLLSRRSSRCAASAASTRAAPRAWSRWAESTWTSARARSSRSWGLRAPARPRCSRSSAASTGRRAASTSSRGSPIETLDDDALSRLRNREIGFVFQAFHLIPQLTVAENVETPLQYAGVPEAEWRPRALRALERVSLTARADHRPNELSGGEAQRAAIARALVTRPRLLLADEPTGNLDSSTGEEIAALLDELHRDGATVVLVTHNEALGRGAQRLVRLRDGRVESEARA